MVIKDARIMNLKILGVSPFLDNEKEYYTVRFTSFVLTKEEYLELLTKSNKNQIEVNYV